MARVSATFGLCKVQFIHVITVLLVYLSIIFFYRVDNNVYLSHLQGCHVQSLIP